MIHYFFTQLTVVCISIRCKSMHSYKGVHSKSTLIKQRGWVINKQLSTNCQFLSTLQVYKYQKYSRVGGSKKYKILSTQFLNDPIHCFSATMSVYKDIFLYQEGVYSKSQFSGTAPLGYHSVKITGWGQENGVPYWVSIQYLLRTKVLLR